MELNLRLRLQTLLYWIHYLGAMEIETFILFLVFVLLTPFIFYSCLSLGMAIFWVLFKLGLVFGVLLFFVTALYWAVIRCPSLNAVVLGNRHEVPKCTIMDAVLSVLFQCGLSFPLEIWNVAMDLFIPKENYGHGFDREELSRSRLKMRNPSRAARVNCSLSSSARSAADQPVDLFIEELMEDVANQPRIRLRPRRRLAT